MADKLPSHKFMKSLMLDIFCICPMRAACNHEFTGWRDFPDGNGGEQICAKCGMGAMAHTLRTGV